jgi:hypothetical protein
MKIKNKIIIRTRNINKKFDVRTEIKTENKKIDLDLFCENKFLSLRLSISEIKAKTEIKDRNEMK